MFTCAKYVSWMRNRWFACRSPFHIVHMLPYANIWSSKSNYRIQTVQKYYYFIILCVRSWNKVKFRYGCTRYLSVEQSLGVPRWWIDFVKPFSATHFVDIHLIFHIASLFPYSEFVWNIPKYFSGLLWASSDICVVEASVKLLVQYRSSGIENRAVIPSIEQLVMLAVWYIQNHFMHNNITFTFLRQWFSYDGITARFRQCHWNGARTPEID